MNSPVKCSFKCLKEVVPMLSPSRTVFTTTKVTTTTKRNNQARAHHIGLGEHKGDQGDTTLTRRRFNEWSKSIAMQNLTMTKKDLKETAMNVPKTTKEADACGREGNG